MPERKPPAPARMQARVYTIRHLTEAPDEVKAELSRTEVTMAVVVDADDARGHKAAKRGNVLAVVKADDLARAMPMDDIQPGLSELDHHDGYVVGRLAKTLKVTGLATLALIPSGIQLPSGHGSATPIRRYRCTGPLHHIVRRPLGDAGEPCPEELAHGSPCPGVLEAY